MMAVRETGHTHTGAVQFMYQLLLFCRRGNVARACAHRLTRLECPATVSLPLGWLWV